MLYRTKYKTKIATIKFAKRILSEEYITNLLLSASIKKYLEANIVFIHIPKSAGSSICNSIYGKRAGHFTRKELESSADGYKLASLPIFTVVRHPYSRTISAYEYAKNGGGENGAIADKSDYRSDCFGDFDCFLSNWLCNRELNSEDRIFWPQHQFVESGKNEVMDHVGRVEELDNTSNWLRSKGYIFNEKMHVNKGVKKHLSVSALSLYQKKTIRDIYRKDFDVFGFEE